MDERASAERVLAQLARAVGGAGPCWTRWIDEPLPDEHHSSGQASPTTVRQRVTEVLAACDNCCEQLLDAGAPHRVPQAARPCYDRRRVRIPREGEPGQVGRSRHVADREGKQPVQRRLAGESPDGALRRGPERVTAGPGVPPGGRNITRLLRRTRGWAPRTCLSARAAARSSEAAGFAGAELRRRRARCPPGSGAQPHRHLGRQRPSASGPLASKIASCGGSAGAPGQVRHAPHAGAPVKGEHPVAVSRQRIGPSPTRARPCGSAARSVELEHRVGLAGLRLDREVAPLLPAAAARARLAAPGGENPNGGSTRPRQRHPAAVPSGSAPPVRYQIGSCRSSSGMSWTSHRPSSSPW